MSIAPILFPTLIPAAGAQSRAPVFPRGFHLATLAVAGVAGIATFATLAVPLPAPAMFIGWIGYSVGSGSPREGVGNLLSFLLGILFGIGTALAIAALTPLAGQGATPIAVTGVVILVLSLRTVAPVNNPLAYFLGLTSFFYSGLAPVAASFVLLGAAGIIGALSAALAGALQSAAERP